MRVWSRVSTLLAIVLILNLVSMVAAPNVAVADERPALTYFAQSGQTFRLPWEAGSVWQITVGNGEGEHSNAANLHGFDAVPAPGRGTDKVVAVADGTVMDFQESMPDSATVNSGHAGNCVIIDHGGSVYSLYAHLAQDSVPLSKGDLTTSGTVIGTMGNSGFSYAPHLHWAVLNSARMYTDANVSPYQTCTGRTIESRYADPDKELQEDGGIPRTGRYYESFNSPSDTGDEITPAEPAAPTETAQPAPDSSAPSEPRPIETTEPEDGELHNLAIGANNCDVVPVTSAALCEPAVGVEFTVTTSSGEEFGTCTTQGPSGIDAPYGICSVPVPFGTTVIVTEDVSTIPEGFAPLENPISVEAPSEVIDGVSLDVVFWNGPQDENATGGQTSQDDDATPGQTSDVSIVTTENGGSATDVCFVLVDFSNEGCDENGDGQVTFDDIPFGTYTVRQTADLGPGRRVEDFTITVSGSNLGTDGQEYFAATVDSASGGTVAQSSPSDPIDIALITRDPDTGDLLTDTCYVLVDYSNEGCDENGDGQVTFDAIPAGSYTVRQTQAPDGYPTVDDYTIDIEPQFDGVPLGYIVKQSPEQNAPDTRNVSAVFLDSLDSTKVVSDICVQFVDASNVGCDDDLLDGQIDFLDVPAGTYEIKFSNIPSGWQVLGPGMVSPTVTIDAGPDAPTNQIIYFAVFVP